VSADNLPPATVAKSLGVASGVDSPLSTFANVFYRGAQAGAQTAACGDRRKSISR
jgi:hypothetical protein